MKKLFLICLAMLALSASVAVVAVSTASAATPPNTCRIGAVYGVPFTKPTVLPNGDVVQEHWLRLMPAPHCTVSPKVTRNISWSYSFPQSKETTSAFDGRTHAEIRMPSPDALVKVYLTVTARGAKRGTCEFLVNDPLRAPFPRYLWGC